jgi:DNA-binding IclR family transcriptional regulator
MSPKQASGETKSLARAVAILDCLTPDQPELGVREIARRLKMSTSTVGRLLTTMHSLGVLRQDPVTHRYRMGSKVLSWSVVHTSGLGVREKARPMLEELHRITQETVNLYVLDRNERVCVDCIESPMRVRVIVNVGERMPLHAGSAGKAILAFGPPDLVQQVIAQPLERMTSNTITNRKKLLEDLDSIRKCGYAVSHGERFADALGLGAPIFDASGRVVAALNVAGPIMRFTDAEVEKFAPQVMALANQVSWALGYNGTSRSK